MAFLSICCIASFPRGTSAQNSVQMLPPVGCSAAANVPTYDGTGKNPIQCGPPLYVNGSVTLGYTTAACTPALGGTLRWNGGNGCFESCNGTAWACLNGTCFSNGQAYSNGQSWTASCPSGETGSIGYLCTNGVPTQTTSTCASSCSFSGQTYANGQTFSASCPSGDAGSITYLCTNGTSTQTSSSCAAPVGSVSCPSGTVATPDLGCLPTCYQTSSCFGQVPCPPGEVSGPNSFCVSVSEYPCTYTNQVRQGDGSCAQVCGAAYYVSSDGTCQPIPGGVSNTNPGGTGSGIP
jgi:hypothetical protein